MNRKTFRQSGRTLREAGEIIKDAEMKPLRIGKTEDYVGDSISLRVGREYNILC